MVLEGILSPFKVMKHPIEGMFLGFLYSSVALLLSIWIFEAYAGLVAVFLTVMAATPLVYNLIKAEEQKDITDRPERTILKEHVTILKFLVFFFLGVTAAITVWYVFLPLNTVSTIFNIQQQTISSINRATSQVTHVSVFSKIFFNNIKVLTFSLLFAFVYGLGAIFILVWNASVIGVAIGNFIRSNLTHYAGLTGFSKIAGYFQVGALGVFKYSLHGIPEILAYFVAGLAGSIISVAIIRHDFMTNKFEKILLDSADLIVISIIILFFAALIEVYLTPILF